VFLPHAGAPGHSWEPWSTPFEGYVGRGIYPTPTSPTEPGPTTPTSTAAGARRS